MDTNRRNTERHTVYLAAEIVVSDEKVASAITRDISPTGLLLLTRTRLELGQRVTLRMLLPDEEDTPVEVAGTVVRREPLEEAEKGTWREKVGFTFDERQNHLASTFESLSRQQAETFGWHR